MRQFLALVWIVGSIALLAWGSGITHKGSGVITMDTDTLNDTASGSGLGIADAYIDGMPFLGRHAFGEIILERSHVDARGYGDSDSGIVYLMYEALDIYTTLDSALGATLPCTLHVDTTNTNVGGRLHIRARIIDSLSDSNLTAPHNVRWELTFRD